MTLKYLTQAKTSTSPSPHTFIVRMSHLRRRGTLVLVDNSGVRSLHGTRDTATVRKGAYSSILLPPIPRYSCSLSLSVTYGIH